MEDIKYQVMSYTPTENSSYTFSNVEPVTNRSTLVTQISKMTVLDDAIERIGLVLGENSAYEYQDARSFGFFIDFDNLLPVISGVTGKSKPRLTPQHLSKIGRINEEAAC